MGLISSSLKTLSSQTRRKLYPFANCRLYDFSYAAHGAIQHFLLKHQTTTCKIKNEKAKKRSFKNKQKTHAGRNQSDPQVKDWAWKLEAWNLAYLDNWIWFFLFF
jgi:hypothetical protein